MKKFIYQYTCLIYSMVQLYFFIAMIIVVVDTSIADQYYGKYGNTVLAAIFGILVYIGMGIFDKFLRGIKNKNFFVDSLLLTLVIPLRFICQIITIVRLHIAHKNGIEDFGLRGNDAFDFSEYIYYYIFNSENQNVGQIGTIGATDRKPKEKRVKKAKEKQIKQPKNKAYKDTTNKGLKLSANPQKDKHYNVYIVPLFTIDELNTPLTFSESNTSSRGRRHIDCIWVDGELIYNAGPIDSPLALSLPRGKHNIKVHVNGYVCDYSKENNLRTNLNFKVKNVSVGYDKVYLCLFLAYSSVYSIKKDGKGKILNKRFVRIESNHKFAQVPLQNLNSACYGWYKSLNYLNERK